MISSPIAALQQGHIVIVPNQRSEQYWLVRCLQSLQSQAIPGNRLYSLNRWMRSLWQQHPSSFSQRLLNDKQAQCWWAHQIFLKNEQRNIKDYIPQAFAAWQRCVRYQVSPHALKQWPLSGSQKLFIEDWLLCSENKDKEGLLFQDDLLACVGDLRWLQQLQKPAELIFFHGFDDWTPALSQIQQVLEQWGCQVVLSSEPLLEPRPAGGCQSFFFENEAQERHAALQWLKEQPLTARSAVIVPDMSSDFALIKENIHRYFESDHQLLPLEQQRAWLAISAGIPLSQHILIRQLLSALKGSAYQEGSLIEADKWPLYSRNLPSYALWDEYIQAVLNILSEQQWLYTAQLSSEEYQASQAFVSTVQELLGLCPQSPAIPYHFFMGALDIALDLTLFQPQSLTDKKMVLGLLEAAALPWDAVWISKAHSQYFPPPVRPHPLLPYEWQIQHKMPQSSPDKEWEYFYQLLKRLFAKVPHIIVSSSGQLPQDWAPLWALFSVPSPSIIPSSILKQQKPSYDKYVFTPAVAASPQQQLSVSQFNAFTQCAFKGWASSLAKAQKEQDIHPIFDPRVWGKVTHLIAQKSFDPNYDPLLNEEFKSWPISLQSYTLKQLSESVKKIPQKLYQKQPLVEKSFVYHVGHIKIKGRADLYWPGQSVIDIKTSHPILRSWFDAEPQDWQGAIYALALEVPSLGLMYVAPSKLSLWEFDITAWQEGWKQQLELYAASWVAGDYQPRPRLNTACLNCAFHDSCRYHLQEISYVSP